MKIRLIDIDSKIPNLALMKISGYYKIRGHKVGFDINNPDRVYVSVIFTWNKAQAAGLKSMFPDSEVVFGGAGWNLMNALPQEIESLKPDYSLYPSGYSQGYTTRGCIRKCGFCIIPEKEGGIKAVQHPSEFHDEKFSLCVLMDNNFLAAPRSHKEAVLKWFIEQGVKMDMTQAFDIRLLTEEWAGYLKDIKHPNGLRFAWDDVSDEERILAGLKILKDAGHRIGHNISFYVLAGYKNSTFEDALYRCNRLRELGVRAYVMPFRDVNYKIKDRRIIKLAKWANQPTFFWSKTFQEFSEKGGGVLA